MLLGVVSVRTMFSVVGGEERVEKGIEASVIRSTVC